MWFEGQIEADFMSVTVLTTARNVGDFTGKKNIKQSKISECFVE